MTFCCQLRKNYRDRFKEDIFAFAVGPNEWAALEKIIRGNPALFTVDQSKPIHEIIVDGTKVILKCGPGVDLIVRPGMVPQLQQFHAEIAQEQQESAPVPQVPEQPEQKIDERRVILCPGPKTLQ